MTRSCAEPTSVRTAAVVLLALTAMLGSAAMAQDTPPREPGAPVQLGPPQSLTPPTPSGATGTAQPGYQPYYPSGVAPVPQAAPVAQPSGQPLKGGISVNKLGEIDSNTVGALDPNTQGLGIDMWKGTKASLVERLLPRIDGLSPLPTARQLARRLLLTAARPPEGAWPKDRPSLVARRIGRLLAFGDVSAANRLLRVVPSHVEEEPVARARMNAAFLANDRNAACGEAQAAAGQHTDVVWRKALVFCQYVAGEAAKAQIGVGLLREQGVKDEAFFSLAQRLAGDKETSFSVPARLTPLHLAMMRAAGVKFSETLTDTADPGALRAIALSPNAGIDTRLEAAERALAAGVLEPEKLRQVYTSVNFTPGDIQGASGSAGNLSGPRGRALLYQAARNQNQPAARAELLSKAFVLARSQGRLEIAVRAFQPLLEEITPTPDLNWFAAEAAKALYYTGAAPVAAARWAELAFRRPHVPGSDAGGPQAAGDQGGSQASSDIAVWPFVAIIRVPLAPRPAPEPTPAAQVQTPATNAPAGAEAQAQGADAPPDFSVVGAGATHVGQPAPNRQGANQQGGTPTAAEALAGVRRVERQGVVSVITTRPEPVTQQPLEVQAQPQSQPQPQPVAAPKFEDAMFDRWRKVQVGVAGEVTAQRRTVLLLSLLDALGVTVPQTAWLETVGGVREMAALPPAGVVQALENAAEAGRLGETVLLTLALLGTDEPEKLHPTVVSAIVKALARVGLAPEARALALEVAFGAGL